MLLLLQIAVILALGRGVRRLLAPLGQPGVIAEMLAGFVIGPSVLGWLAPALTGWLFPASSLPPLNALSQIGLNLFMFIVGVRVGTHSVVTSRRVAVVTSAASIAVPFAAGVALAFRLHDHMAPQVNAWSFALFLGTSMSITAFPVLARILDELDLLHTEIGRLAIACAAFDDVSGWLLLGGVLSLTGTGSTTLGLPGRMVTLAVYVALMFGIVRPALRRLAAGGRLPSSSEGLWAVLLVLLLSGAATDAIGVHALFGAFLAGVIMPKHSAVESAVAAIEPLTVTIFLPLFFAFTGLQTRIQLINSRSLVADTAAIIAVAIVGKGGGAAFTARAMGLSWRDAGALGALVNTRGLIELVVLGIGRESGMLSPLAFSALVLMTLVTTVMTSPLLSFLLPRGRLIYPQ